MKIRVEIDEFEAGVRTSHAVASYVRAMLKVRSLRRAVGEALLEAEYYKLKLRASQLVEAQTLLEPASPKPPVRRPRRHPPRRRSDSHGRAGDVPLADRIGQALDAGTLPRVHPKKMMWDGISSGDEMCCGCGDRILRTQVTYKGDVADVTYRFHAGCYGLWVGQLILRALYRPK